MTFRPRRHRVFPLLVGQLDRIADCAETWCVAIAAEAGDVEARPENGLRWEKYAEPPGKPNAADVSEFRKRMGLAPIKYDDDEADTVHEMPTDDRGVYNTANEAAAQGE